MAIAKDPLKSHGSTLTAQTVLTPRQRRKLQPSFSPIKNSEESTPLRAAKSLSDLHMESSRNVKSHPAPVHPTTALNFNEVSIQGPTGSLEFGNASKEIQDAVNAYLLKHYGGRIFMERPPFMFIECKTVPPENERPFTIGGMLAVRKEESEYAVEDLETYPGYGGDSFLPDEISDLFNGPHQPPELVALYLASVVFPDCDALSFFYNTLTVEYPQDEDKKFLVRLNDMPSQFLGTKFDLMYCNGPLPSTERRR